MLWHRQAIFKSKRDKLCSSAECRIWTRDPRQQIASRLNARWQTDLAIEDQAKILNLTALPYDQRAFSPLDPTVSWLSHLALRYTYLLLISMLWHRQAIFKSKRDKLCSSARSRILTWDPRHQIASRLNARWQTDWAIEDQAKNLNSTARPYDQWAFSPLDPTVSWLSHLALAIYILLLSISMLWHRQAIFKSKRDKLCSSAECRIWTRDPRHQIASRLNARWQTDWAIEDQAKILNLTALPMISEHSAQLTPLSVDFCTWLLRYPYVLLSISMFWHRQAIFKSNGDKLCSTAESRIWTREPKHQIASRLNARWQTDWAIEDQARNMNSTARPYGQRAISPLDPTVSWLSHLALRYTYLLLLISMLWHRQAVFKSKGDKLCSSAGSRILTRDTRHQIASRLNARWQTDWAIEDQAQNWNSTARPYCQPAFSPLDPTVSWLSHLALRYTYLLLLISMLWHRQAVFKSKREKLCSSAECRIWSRDPRQ